MKGILRYTDEDVVSNEFVGGDARLLLLWLGNPMMLTEVPMVLVMVPLMAIQLCRLQFPLDQRKSLFSIFHQHL